MRILVFVNCYIPGYKSGGPIRSIANLVSRLGEKYEFSIVTNDRDRGDIKCYETVIPNDWNNLKNARVFYLSPDRRRFRDIHKLITETDFDVIYLNSFWSVVFSLYPLISAKLNRKDFRVILAPRGEFSPQALMLKQMKKRLYLLAVKLLRLHKNIVWHVSSEKEKAHLLQHFAIEDDRLVIAPNLPGQYDLLAKAKTPRKDRLSIVFLSRITEMKNLRFAISALGNCKAKLTFDIYGPISNRHYWQECLELIDKINKKHDSIMIQYKGAVDHHDVVDVLSNYDLFFMPTLGENYGHIILEALNAGLPVLISDQTPWVDLEEKGVGWTVSLGEKQQFSNIIDQVAGWDDEKISKARDKVLAYAEDKIHDPKVLEQNMRLFDKFYTPL